MIDAAQVTMENILGAFVFSLIIYSIWVYDWITVRIKWNTQLRKLEQEPSVIQREIKEMENQLQALGMEIDGFNNLIAREIQRKGEGRT
jgi:hypothetical protein